MAEQIHPHQELPVLAEQVVAVLVIQEQATESLELQTPAVVEAVAVTYLEVGMA